MSVAKLATGVDAVIQSRLLGEADAVRFTGRSPEGLGKVATRAEIAQLARLVQKLDSGEVQAAPNDAARVRMAVVNGPDGVLQRARYVLTDALLWASGVGAGAAALTAGAVAAFGGGGHGMADAGILVLGAIYGVGAAAIAGLAGAVRGAVRD